MLILAESRTRSCPSIQQLPRVRRLRAARRHAWCQPRSLQNHWKLREVRLGRFQSFRGAQEKDTPNRRDALASVLARADRKRCPRSCLRLKGAKTDPCLLNLGTTCLGDSMRSVLSIPSKPISLESGRLLLMHKRHHGQPINRRTGTLFPARTSQRRIVIRVVGNENYR